MKPSLYVLAAAFELLGIGLLAAPDLVPGAIRAAGWIRVKARAVENRVRRLLGLPRHVTVYAESATATLSASGQISTIVGTSATTVEDRVAFLLRRDHDIQEAINDVRHRLEEIERASQRGLRDLGEELRGHVTDTVAAARADYRAARLWGVAVLVIGLGLGTWANLAS
jgi:hypothetical protein